MKEVQENGGQEDKTGKAVGLNFPFVCLSCPSDSIHVEERPLNLRLTASRIFSCPPSSCKSSYADHCSQFNPDSAAG